MSAYIRNIADISDIHKPFSCSSGPLDAPLYKAQRILIVDDSRSQRMILVMSLKRCGYDVDEAPSAEEALKMCQHQHFDIILSDWVMDGMSGLELCRSIRGMQSDTYAYFILLTSKSRKEEIAKGLEAGADDFLSKPFAADELRARLRAGERVLAMQKEVIQKNKLLALTVSELQNTHEVLARDLSEARKLQQALIPETFRVWESGQIALFLKPAGHVGGDLVGFFEIDDSRIGIYSLDVSGHGVASAMMTARLAGYFSDARPNQNIALRFGADGAREAFPAEKIASRFNCIMLDELQVDQYFTMTYAELNMDTGRVSLVQAGHPHPMVVRQNGTIEYYGKGGLPIGLFPDAQYTRVDLALQKGDRLFLLSDGVTECFPAPDNTPLSFCDARLEHLLLNVQHTHLKQVPDILLAGVAASLGGDDCTDDLSGIIFEYGDFKA